MRLPTRGGRSHAAQAHPCPGQAATREVLRRRAGTQGGTARRYGPRLDRSNDGQDHTVLLYARFACSPQGPMALCTLPSKYDETNLTAPFVRTMP